MSLTTTTLHRQQLLSAVPDNLTAAPPVIDFSPFYGSDLVKKQSLVDQVRLACQAKGFFQITNHRVDEELLSAMFQQSKDFFSLPVEEKVKLDKANHPNKLGYEPLRSQNFEKKTAGDLKEGFFIGRRLPADHPYVSQRRIHCGSNVYPDSVSDPVKFMNTVDSYHAAMTLLAEDVLSVLALTLGLNQDYFKCFCTEPAAVLRLLHYPPQASDASEYERGKCTSYLFRHLSAILIPGAGIGAHTDFGTLTLLLQDEVGGLQVFDAPTMSWIDVKPIPGAFVVNLGNIMMRWSNDRYVSNLHRVINNSGRERYSIPFFYTGNPDFTIRCLPGCEDAHGSGKYPQFRVEDWILGRHTNTFKEAKGIEEPSILAKVA